MYIRLGFSVAINVDPEILLIDEILTVGDESFQRKCAQKFDDFKDSGKTIVHRVARHGGDEGPLRRGGTARSRSARVDRQTR